MDPTQPNPPKTEKSRSNATQPNQTHGSTQPKPTYGQLCHGQTDRQTHATESITHMGNKYGGKSAGNVAAIYWSITGRIRSAV